MTVSAAVPSVAARSAIAAPDAARWGEAVRSLWGLEPGLRFLNHGGFGATPLALLARQAEWRERMERNPPRFFVTELPILLRQAAAALGDFVKVAPERLGFLPNATAGTGAVLRALNFAPDDEILFTDHVYNAVRNLLRHVADRSGARLVEATLSPVVTDAEAIVTAIATCLSPRTRLVIVDHVASASAITFPVAALASLCRARGVPILVDGAHAPGLLDLDVDAIGADWYVGNCHKWLCAPKGSAFIAVADRTVPEVHPLAISHAYGQGFAAEFDKIGTHDPSAVLTVPDALAFHDRIGGAALRARNAALALSAATALAAELGTGLGAAPALFHAMATVRLPGGLAPTRETLTGLNEHLWQHHRIEAAFTTIAGTVFLRLSAQAYNQPADYADLAPVLRTVIAAVAPA